MAKEPIKYSPEQKKLILDFWNSRPKDNPPSLSEMMNLLSGGETDDVRRSPWGPILRKILNDAQIIAKTKVHQKVEEYVLTDSAKEFIINNIKENRAIDLARTLNPGTKISPLGRELRAINNYLKEVGAYVVKKEEGTFPEGKYVPPNTIHGILAKVNTYLHLSLSTQSKTAYQTKCLETTLQFLHSPRFLQEINNYATVEKRMAFESEFIRGVFDKPDLQPDEINLYINLCNDYIQASDIKKQLEKLNGVLDTITDDPEGKISMSLSDAIGKVTSSYNECVNRHQKLYATLNTTRSKRILDKNSATANIVNIFEFFREEESRRIFLKQAEILRENRANEVKKIQSLDDILLMALGMSIDEAVI